MEWESHPVLDPQVRPEVLILRCLESWAYFSFLNHSLKLTLPFWYYQHLMAEILSLQCLGCITGFGAPEFLILPIFTVWYHSFQEILKRAHNQRMKLKSLFPNSLLAPKMQRPPSSRNQEITKWKSPTLCIIIGVFGYLPLGFWVSFCHIHQPHHCRCWERQKIR